MSNQSVIQHKLLCNAVSCFVSKARNDNNLCFVILTDEVSQIHGDWWQNVRTHGK